MGIERDRGISVVTSVMTFEYRDCVFNLLDTPGHEDFSEDTYRTLTAVDSAVMVIDAAKGIEARTRKLFEICRLRDIPIITFINKMDREARDPIELLDEVSSTLALDTCPVTWPIGRAAEFAGTYDLRSREMHLINDLPQSDPRMQTLGDEVDLVRAALPEFDVDSFNAGHLTPVYFGSAIKGIGVRGPTTGWAGGIWTATSGAAGRHSHRRSRGTRSDGPGLQDSGEHGPEPSRPHRFRSCMFRAPRAGHAPEAKYGLASRSRCTRRSSFSRESGKLPMKRLPATWSVSPTTAHCGSAIRSPRARISNSLVCRISLPKSSAGCDWTTR